MILVLATFFANASLSDDLIAAKRRFLPVDEAEVWSGVGRLNARGGFCTAALIRPDTLLTAAHCIADAASRTVADPSEIRFIAGCRDSYNIGIVLAKSVNIYPGYFATGASNNERQVRTDVAKIMLRRPIPDVVAFRVADTPSVGAEVALLSYSRNRQSRLSIQTLCRTRGRKTEFLELDCRSAPGARIGKRAP